MLLQQDKWMIFGTVNPLSIAAVLFACLPSVLPAQMQRDKITFRRDNGSLIRVNCYITDYNGKRIQYRLRDGGTLQTKPADEVVGIETPQMREHIDGLKLLGEGKTAEAAAEFEKALRQESREWLRRDILALLVKCALRQNDYARAGSRFLLLYQSASETRHYELIPLLWPPKPPTAKLKAQAERWMNLDDPTAKLLGASALLFDRDRAGVAEVELKRLGVNADRRVQQLSLVQLWRKDLRNAQQGEPSDIKLTSWLTSIDSIPKNLRGGAWFLLGEARKRRRHYDRAAQALLWVSLVYDHDYQLAALAHLHAADSLRAIGQHLQADSLYRETVQRFSQSTYSQDAASALREAELGER